MANMYNISELFYTPSNNREWFSRAIFGGELLEKGKIMPLEGVKKSTNLNLFDLSDPVLKRDLGDCSWDPDQAIKLSNKTLEVINYRINLEQCLDALEEKNTIWLQTPGAKNRSLPTELEALTLERIANQVSNQIEQMIFTGKAASGEFDGVVATLTASTKSVKVDGVALTNENILAEIQKVYMAIPLNVRASGKKNGTLCLYLSYEAYELVMTALATVYNSNVVINPNFTMNGEIIKYMGVELVPVYGLYTNTMVAANWTNLILGTDLISDTQEVRLGQFAPPNDNKIFIDARFRIGFAIPFEDEAVLYTDIVVTP